MRALVTGSEGGLGRAICTRLEREGYEVERLDIATGFDVSDPHAWERVEAVDLACLNAGILTGTGSIRELTDEQYADALGVNVDGVVLGVRRLANVMREGAIVVTASLAGLVGMESDPIYALTKHALIGFVRSVAPQLEPVRIAAVCPGIADTPMFPEELRGAFEAQGFPLLQPDDVAEAVWRAAHGETGAAWYVQPGREPAPFRFPNVPGARRADEAAGPPPLQR